MSGSAHAADGAAYQDGSRSTEPGPTARRTRDPGALDGPWAYTVNWGDGSAASVGQRTATGTIPATYAYQKNGTYTVTVSVSDKDGGVGRASYTVAVGQTKTRR